MNTLLLKGETLDFPTEDDLSALEETLNLYWDEITLVEPIQNFLVVWAICLIKFCKSEGIEFRGRLCVICNDHPGFATELAITQGIYSTGMDLTEIRKHIFLFVRSACQKNVELWNKIGAGGIRLCCRTFEIGLSSKA